MNYWFTSDLHLGHGAIIEYCNRPFKDSFDMNDRIIHNWNQRVKKEDVVFHIGDFCFKHSLSVTKLLEQKPLKAKEWEEKLNGKIIFIKGNHDNNNSCKTNIRNIKIEFGGHLLNLVHKPEHADFSVKINLVGHVHNAWKFQRRFNNESQYTDCINVGIDVNDFRPQSFNKLYSDYCHWKKINYEKE